MRVMEIITYIAAVIAAFVLFATESSANGAPQEAAGAALALGIVVIPYCVTATMQRARFKDTSYRD
jgi:hypothetical protein